MQQASLSEDIEMGYASESEYSDTVDDGNTEMDDRDTDRVAEDVEDDMNNRDEDYKVYKQRLDDMLNRLKCTHNNYSHTIKDNIRNTKRSIRKHVARNHTSCGINCDGCL